MDRSWRDEQYRQQITGTGGGHLVHGVRYDGWDPAGNLLLGAVPPGGALVIAAGYPHARLAMRHELLLRARREAWASPGCPVQWHVAEPAAEHPVRVLLDGAGLGDRFLVRYTEPQDRPPVTRPAPATGWPRLAARWSDRSEDAAQCAERLLRMLHDLERLVPRMAGGWEAVVSPVVGTVPVAGHRAAARQLLLMGQSFRDDPADMIAELGFLFTARGGHGEQRLSFQLSCGVHAASPELLNAVVLDLPPSLMLDGESAKAEAIQRAVEDAWEAGTDWIAGPGMSAGPPGRGHASR